LCFDEPTTPYFAQKHNGDHAPKDYQDYSLTDCEVMFGGFRGFGRTCSDYPEDECTKFLSNYQLEPVQAGIYLLFYTLLASLPLLVGILFIYSPLGSLYLFLLCGNGSLVGNLFYVCIVFAFLVKMPMFMVHL
jgi:hypothetical protein